MVIRLFLLFVLSFASSLLVFASDTSTATLIEDGHYKRAQAILASRLKANPNDARSYEEMSKVSEAFARWDEAIQQAEKAVSLGPRVPEFQAALADAIGSKLSGAQLGAFQKLSLARRFKKEAERALQLDPNNVDASQDLMEFHLDAPGILGGDKKRAAELADHMVQVNPVRGYLLKFEFAKHEKHRGELESLLKMAIHADPKSYEAHVQAANFYLAQGADGLAQAEEQAKQAIHIAPGKVRGYSVLAAIYAEQGRWKELDTVLTDAQQAVPDDLTPFYQAGNSILTNGQTQELARAEKYMRAYLDQAPEGAEPTLAWAHWRLALILDKEGHRDQARQQLQQAVALDPALESAKKDLKRLQ
ncbi:MAG TPA: hypothetical protein VI685_02755 [Candidatus Angelobacter sp.]